MRRNKLFSLIGAIALIAVMVFSFAGCEQKIGSGSNEDAINIVNKGFETDYGYERFYWNATIKTKAATGEFDENDKAVYVLDAKGQPVYNATTYNVQYDPTDAENPKGYFYSSTERKSNADNTVVTKVNSDEHWFGKYYETTEIREKAQEGRKEDVSQKGIFLMNKIVQADAKDLAYYVSVSVDSLFEAKDMGKYNLSAPLDILKDLIDSGEYDVVESVRSGVVNNVTLKMKGKYIAKGYVRFTVLDIVDENKKQTTMLSSVSNEFNKDNDKDFYEANQGLDEYFTYNFLDAGSKINPVTGLSAAEFVDSINNPAETKKDFTTIIIIAVVVVLVVALVIAYFVYRKIRKKKHAEFMARKEAANEAAESAENAEAENVDKVDAEATVSETEAVDAEKTAVEEKTVEAGSDDEKKPE